MSHRWERTREDDKYSGAAPGQRPVQLVDWCDAARVERPAGPISSECLSFTHLRLGSSSSATGSSRCGRPSASQTAAAATHTFLPVPDNPNQPVVYLLSRRMKPISLFPSSSSSFSRLVLFIFFSPSLSLYIINNKFLFFSLSSQYFRSNLLISSSSLPCHPLFHLPGLTSVTSPTDFLSLSPAFLTLMKEEK